MKDNSLSSITTWLVIYLLIGDTNSWNIERNHFHGLSGNRTQRTPKMGRHEALSGVSSSRNDGIVVMSDTPDEEREIPKFMLDVFRMFEKNHFLQPTSNIIRSFHNLASRTVREAFTSINDECARYPQLISCRRKYMMLFNVSKIPVEERVTGAELRFRYLTTTSGGSDVDIKVDHIYCGMRGHDGADEQCNSQCNSRQLIRRKSFTASQEGWLTFDVTHLLRKLRGNKCFHKIEVDLLVRNRQAGMVRIDSSPTSSNEPLLVVFSDDPSKHGRFESQYETNNLIAEEEKIIAEVSEVGSSTKRRKRSAPHEKKMDVRVDGIKIGVKRRTAHAHHSKSREKRSSRHPDSCHREEMEINFAKLGYNHIHTPANYQAYKCVGHCYFPITIDTTRHAIFHATKHFRRAVEEAPCCVPTKLGPISVLIHYIESDVVQYVYEYHEMTVQECGCR